MKSKWKVLSMITAFVLIFDLMMPLVGAKAATAPKEIEIILDGEKLKSDVAPIMKDYRVLVPFRVILESLGTTVQWNSNGTITSKSENSTIELKVDSKTAYVNGEKVTLDVAPTIVKGRTLVPLRFVSENNDATVGWYPDLSRVTVTKSNKDGSTNPPKPPVQPQTYSLYFNDKKVNTELLPFIKNGRVYVALESFIPAMQSEINWYNLGDRMVIQLDDVEVLIYADKNYVLINGEPVSVTEQPIKHKDAFYVPLSFVKETFGGISQYNQATKTVYIKINKAEFSSEFLPIEQVSIVRPVNVPTTVFAGNRRLMVSDNPEMLTSRTVPRDEETLWTDEVHSDKSTLDHRVYGWHVNMLKKKVNIGITIENLSSTNEIEVSNVKGIDFNTSNGWYHHDVGLPMAEAVLTNKMKTIQLDNPIVKENETTLIQSFELEEEFLIGFLQDLTVRKVSGSGDLNYKIRTVVSQSNSNLTFINDDPVQVDRENLHPRGVWEGSQLQTTLPTYDVGSGEKAFSISNGVTDNLMVGESSLSGSPFDLVRNPGHFGATYKVKIPFANFTGQSKTVRVRIAARGGRYNGAVKVNNQVYLIPTLQPSVEVANIIDHRVYSGSSELELEIMHSGGASLPIAIDLITID
ncbi:copper amine oxidase N-terminal domain-containing protein [Cytobacillus sp. FJAT-53684]|uniref:Copper amine oxidase N-terminal domain-containing protein n=1 Tax=Cytobacillus mangrovibacter TaxID=3299024 RepID=A0ABW6JX28_9BACI